MMRWEPTNTDKVGVTQTESAGRGPEVSAARYLLDAVAATVAGLGTRSVVIMLVMALIVATLLFGLSGDETAAYARWCPSC